MKKWCLSPILCCCLLFSFSSCSPEWQKKFIRQKEKAVEPTRFELQAAFVPYETLYKQHFNAWRNWQRELIHHLGANHKKEIQCIRETRRHLSVLSKYLVDEKAVEVKELVAEFDRLTAQLKKGRLDASQYGLLSRRLNALELKIDNHLRVSKRAKEDYLQTPIPINMDEYAGDEPLDLEAREVKGETEPADNQENGELSYEQYRALTVS